MTAATDAPRKKRPGRKGVVGKLLPMLTDDALRDLLHRDVLRANQRPPPRDCILSLAEKLSFFRFMASQVGQEVLTKAQTHSKEMIAALNGIVRLSPFFVEQIQDRIAFKRGHLSVLSENELLKSEQNDKITSTHSAIKDLRINQSKFRELQRSCEALIETDCCGLNATKSPIYTWHDIAHDLAVAFRLAMRPTNPALKMGLSNKGPIPRFIAAVVPHITGERPNVEQVGKYLKDNPPSLAVSAGQGQSD